MKSTMTYYRIVLHNLLEDPNDTPHDLTNIVGVIRYDDHLDYSYLDNDVWGYDAVYKTWVADTYRLPTHPLIDKSEPSEVTTMEGPVIAWLEEKVSHCVCTDLLNEKMQARKEE